MKNNASQSIPGYAYGAEHVAKSSISLRELEQMKTSVGFTPDDERYLRLAGEVLGDQTKQIVERWRSGIIAGIPHLARHSRSSEGNPLPNYLAASNQRFQQWILDTCLRPYDQTWLDYQQETGLFCPNFVSPSNAAPRIPSECGDTALKSSSKLVQTSIQSRVLRFIFSWWTLSSANYTMASYLTSSSESCRLPCCS